MTDVISLELEESSGVTDVKVCLLANCTAQQFDESIRYKP
jgi:hypothetical protein